MSTHNLQQFDEALLDEIVASSETSESVEVRRALNRRKRMWTGRSASVRFSQRELIVVAVAAVVCIVSLVYASLAHRRAQELQERIDSLEAQISR
jgi:hypothetical protein